MQGEEQLENVADECSCNNKLYWVIYLFTYFAILGFACELLENLPAGGSAV